MELINEDRKKAPAVFDGLEENEITIPESSSTTTAPMHHHRKKIAQQFLLQHFKINDAKGNALCVDGKTERLDHITTLCIV